MEQFASLFACHQLIDEDGKLHTASIIRVCGDESHAQYECAFDYKERAFLIWLGGTIILSPKEEVPVKQGETLEHYLEQTSTLVGKAESVRPVYAWHTPLLDITAPLQFPLRKITNSLH